MLMNGIRIDAVRDLAVREGVRVEGGRFCEGHDTY